MNSKYILYGGALSYFTGKARAYLRWKGVDFEERPATAAVYQEIIVPRIGYPMIPLLITPDDEAIQDTSEIIDYFEAREREPSALPEGPRQRLAAHMLELYGDEWLVIPAMHYRWAYNKDFALGEFGKIVDASAPLEARREMGAKLAERFMGAVPLLGVTPETASAIEASYEALLAELNAHFAKHDYLFGSRPSIGDFGLIGPLYAHLYRDPESGKMMKSRAPLVAAWVERMQNPPSPRGGEFLSDDAIPETLLPILRRMMREHTPCLVDLTKKLAAWRRENPDTDIPRAIGMHEFTIEGTTGQRIILPYTQWMLQRALDSLNTLEGEARQSALAFLDNIGGGDFKTIKIAAPVRRENHRLVWG